MGNTFNTIYQFFVCKAKENIKLYVYIDKITCIWKASIVWDPINSFVFRVPLKDFNIASRSMKSNTLD
jgi:hypothetical protein